MGYTGPLSDKDRERAELDDALHEPEREIGQHKRDEDGDDDRHLSRFVPAPSTSLTTP